MVVMASVVGVLDIPPERVLIKERLHPGRIFLVDTGEGRIIHASSGSRRVRYDDLDSPRGRWFIENLTGVRRVLLLTSDRTETTLLSDSDMRRPSRTLLAHAVSGSQ